MVIFLSIIGVILLAAPFIALFFDLKKSRQYGVFILFLGLFILFFIILKYLEGIIYPTLFAFSSVPLLFIYIFALGKVNKKHNEESNEILDN
jgi:hypothetical protein